MNYSEALNLFINKLQLDSDARLDRAGLPRDTYQVQSGRKNDKIVKVQAGVGRSAYCFVDRETGNILKAAGWNAPAKGTRGSIFEPKCYMNVDTSYGSWLYAR
jgi:hypothetical protein